jgi:hypothetical protein
MENKRGKLALMLVTLVLLLGLVVGSVAPGLAVQVAAPWTGAVDAWDGLHGLLANPHAGGGGGTGGV